jgi:hypothetical protein
MYRFNTAYPVVQRFTKRWQVIALWPFRKLVYYSYEYPYMAMGFAAVIGPVVIDFILDEDAGKRHKASIYFSRYFTGLGAGHILVFILRSNCREALAVCY